MAGRSVIIRKRIIHNNKSDIRNQPKRKQYYSTKNGKTMKKTNKHNISLPLSVFLLHDEYDYDDRSNSISATTLLKPLRSIILARQSTDLQKEVDISDLIASSMGSALHCWNEQAWLKSDTVLNALRLHGLTDEQINKIRINPDPATVKQDEYPIYVELRAEKELDDFIITGKFDLCLNGKLSDIKSCSVWSHIYDSNAEDYTLQGSIYKWLNQDKVTSNSVSIEKIFTDWSATSAKQKSDYPQTRVLTKDYPLFSIEETELWIKKRLSAVSSLADLPQSDLPECTSEELWKKDDTWKYYKKAGAKRATKNYTSKPEAEARLTKDGGELRFFPGEVVRCKYCSVVEICDQAKKYVNSGLLSN